MYLSDGVCFRVIINEQPYFTVWKQSFSLRKRVALITASAWYNVPLSSLILVSSSSSSTNFIAMQVLKQNFRVASSVSPTRKLFKSNSVYSPKLMFTNIGVMSTLIYLHWCKKNCDTKLVNLKSCIYFHMQPIFTDSSHCSKINGICV